MLRQLVVNDDCKVGAWADYLLLMRVIVDGCYSGNGNNGNNGDHNAGRHWLSTDH